MRHRLAACEGASSHLMQERLNEGERMLREEALSVSRQP